MTVGVLVLTPRRFLPGRHLTYLICFYEQGRTITVKALFARCETNPVQMLERNAFYFEFPDPQNQYFLELEIERLQIEKASNHCVNYQFLSNLEGV